jgi:hypothetical protein
MQIPDQLRRLSRQRRQDSVSVAGSLGDWHALLDLLRETGFPITVDREERFVALLWRLTEAGVRLDDATTATEYLAPVLCSSSEDQLKLREILTLWLDREQRDKRPTREPWNSAAGSLSLQLKASDWRRIVGAVTAVAAVLTGVFVLRYLGYFAPASTTPGFGVEHPIFTVPLINSALRSTVEGFLSRLLFTLPAILCMLLVLSRRRSSQARLARAAGEVELVETFGIPTAASDLFRSVAARTAIHELKRTGLVQSDRLDVRRTIDNTLRSFGWPTIHMASWRTSREIVLLVDTTTTSDHMKLLGDALELRLRAADALMTRYDFRINPGRARLVSGRAEGPQVDDFSAIAMRHLHQKLIIVSVADCLFDGGDTQLDPEIAKYFPAFSSLVLLTPTLEKHWGDRERTLVAAGIFVATLTVSGLEQIADLVRRDPEEPLIRLARTIPEGTDMFLARLGREYYRYNSDQPPATEEVDQLARRLRLWMGSDENFTVLVAIAAFPKVDPKLTLVLGRLLLGRSADNDLVMRLARLPWMRDGRIPDWLRIALFNQLPEEAQKRVRMKILAMLDTARRKKGSDAAWRDLEERIAAFDVAIPKDQLLGNLPADNVDPSSEIGEHIFLSFIRGDKLDPVKDALEPPAPDAITRVLGQDFNRRTVLVTGAFVGLAAILFVSEQYIQFAIQVLWGKTWVGFLSPLQLPQPTLPYARAVAVACILSAIALFGRTTIYRPEHWNKYRLYWLSLAGFAVAIGFLSIGNGLATPAVQSGPRLASSDALTAGVATVLLLWFIWIDRPEAGWRTSLPFSWKYILKNDGLVINALILTAITFPAAFSLILGVVVVGSNSSDGSLIVENLPLIILIGSIGWSVSLILVRRATIGNFRKPANRDLFNLQAVTDLLFPLVATLILFGTSLIVAQLSSLVGRDIDQILGFICVFFFLLQPALFFGYVGVGLRLAYDKSTAPLIKQIFLFCTGYWIDWLFFVFLANIFSPNPPISWQFLLFLFCMGLSISPTTYLAYAHGAFLVGVRRSERPIAGVASRRLRKSLFLTSVYFVAAICIIYLMAIYGPYDKLGTLLPGRANAGDAKAFFIFTIVFGITRVLPFWPALRFLSPAGFEIDQLQSSFAEARPQAPPAADRSNTQPSAPGKIEVPLEELRSAQFSDEETYTVWVKFRSRSGNRYTAVHVYEHPSGPYILLSSPDRNIQDFEKTRSDVAAAFNGTPDMSISNRSDDIADTIQVSAGFTGARIAAGFATLTSLGYSDISIEAIHKKRETQKPEEQRSSSAKIKPRRPKKKKK